GGPKLIMFVVDGVLNDGGAVRQYGWGRFPADLGDVNGLERVRLAPTLLGRLRTVRVYDRALRVSEAVGNHRGGCLSRSGRLPILPSPLSEGGSRGVPR